MPDRVARDMAAAAAQAWGTPIHPPRPIGDGATRVFDVTLSDGRRIAMRLYPPHGPNGPGRALIETRMRVAETLADAGFATPWPQRCTTGALTHAVADSCATAQQWIVARPVDLAPSGPARARMMHDLGALLADLHLTADAVAPAGMPPPGHGHATAPTVLDLVAGLANAPDLSATDRASFGRATDAARAGLAALADQPKGVIHGDPTPKRVLCAIDGLYLIGVDRAGTGWRAQDLAAALWPHVDAPDLPHLRDALATGYVAGGGAVANTSPDRIALFHALRALGEAVWLRPGDPRRAAATARILAIARITGA